MESNSDLNNESEVSKCCRSLKSNFLEEKCSLCQSESASYSCIECWAYVCADCISVHNGGTHHCLSLRQLFLAFNKSARDLLNEVTQKSQRSMQRQKEATGPHLFLKEREFKTDGTGRTPHKFFSRPSEAPRGLRLPLFSIGDQKVVNDSSLQADEPRQNPFLPSSSFTFGASSFKPGGPTLVQLAAEQQSDRSLHDLLHQLHMERDKSRSLEQSLDKIKQEKDAKVHLLQKEIETLRHSLNKETCAKEEESQSFAHSYSYIAS